MKLVMTVLSTTLSLAAAASALAGSVRHPSGTEFSLPQGWQVQSQGGLTALTPPDQAKDLDGNPAEVYMLALGPTYGADRAADPGLTHQMDAELRRLIPALSLAGPPQVVRAADREALSLGWEGRSPDGRPVAARVFVAMGDGYTVTILALGEASTLARRDAQLREILSGLSIGEARIDRSIVGLWTYSNSSSYTSGYGEFAMSFATASRGALQLSADGTFAVQDSSAIAGGGEDASFHSGDDGDGEILRGRWFASNGTIGLVFDNGLVINAEYACDGSGLEIRSDVNDFNRTYRASR